MRVAGIDEHIRHEPDEWCPTLLSIGVASQGVIIALASIVLFVTITFRAANLGDDYITWGITVSLLIGGAITVLQAGRLGRLGAAHILMTGASPHFIAVSVLALQLGGISMLASLSDQAEVPEEHEISFRLLRHYASSVSHRKYHGIDIVTVQVEGSG